FNFELGSLRASVPTLAWKLGYVEEEGIDAQFAALTGVDAINAIAIGKTDVQVMSVYQTLAHIAQGTDVAIFGGTAAEGSTVITTSEKVEYFKDLINWRGAVVATTRLNNADFVTRAKLLEAGVDPQTEITYKEFDDNTLVVQAIVKGEADVAVVTNEFISVAREAGLDVSFPVRDIAPMYVCCRHTGRKSDIEANRQKYVNIYIAELRAYKVYLEDHQRTIDILKELAREDDEFVNNYLYSPESSSPLTLDPSLNKIKALYGLLQEWGKIEDGISVADSIDVTIYEDALKEVIRRYPDDKLYQRLLEEFYVNNSEAFS
ncbi:MAG: ABC transporter substrate-binding protein, partial [Oscillospiraceae bacterium]|nr:ABC transporter substrate-binding protein [Oscillospiraceae bacterium]